MRPHNVNVAKTIQRVLIYRLGSLGDTVVALPCFRLVARVFPEADRRLLTNFPVNQKAPASSTILANTGSIHRYFSYPVALRSTLNILRFWWTLLRWHPQILIYLGPARGIQTAYRDRLFFFLCGIWNQIGVPTTAARQTNLLQLDTRTYEPEAARLARVIRKLGDAHLGDPHSWDLQLTPAELNTAEELLAPAASRPLLAVSLGTKRQANDWTLPNWQALITHLASALPSYALILTGVADEHGDTETLAEAWRSHNPHPALNLCGQLTPRETAAVLSRACGFVGHDSGAMHLAAAVQTPCVAIFSARQKPGIWFPHGPQHRVLYRQVDCFGCGLETCTVQQKKCILSITVEEVAQEVLHLLAGLPTAPPSHTAPDSTPDRYTFSAADRP